MPAPSISAATLRFFRRIVRGYFRRNFHAVRISGQQHFAGITGPVIVYANHSSWWDPMVSILLAERFHASRSHYAPMDADALKRYPILKRIGIFPVEMKTQRGAVQFLRVSEAILNEGGILWVTPQGRFVDARQRPLFFKPGLAALVRRIAEQSGACTVLPLAIEYPFWDERLPEVLLHFSQPIHIAGVIESTDPMQTRLIAALEEAMEDLKNLALQRDPAAFQTLLGGRQGTGGFYALGQRLKAMVLRRPYRAEHTRTAKPDGVGE